MKSQIIKYMNYVMNKWSVRDNPNRIVNDFGRKRYKILHVAETIEC